MSLIKMNEDMLFFKVVNKFEKRIISLIKWFVIGVIMLVLTTETLKLGLKYNYSYYTITTFNWLFYGILKYLLVDKWNVFNQEVV